MRYTLILAFGAACMAEIAAGAPALIPQPLRAELTGGAPFRLVSHTPITFADPRLAKCASMLSDYLAPATGFRLSAAETRSSRGGIHLRIDGSLRDLGDEGYALTSGADRIVISAPTNAGVFYGIQTLRQLLPPEVYRSSPASGVEWLVPAVVVRDKPRFGFRSFMLDVARNFKPKSVVKMLLEQMAQHKMNRFHWHLTDDQGWRIEIKKYPRLVSVGAKRPDTQIGGWGSAHYTGQPHCGFYTQDEIREIVEYAADRHITIIPEIGMPGHASALLASYPEYRCADNPVPEVHTSFGKKPHVLDVSNEKLYPFISDIIDEVIELFPGDTIHIGGDEVQKGHWKRSKSIKALMGREGIKGYSGVQVYFTNRVVGMIQKKGRRVMGWNEITHTDGNAGRQLAETAIVQFWRGSAGQFRKCIGDGYSCVNSTAGGTYLDYSYAKLQMKSAYHFDPVPGGLSAAEAKRIIGMGCQMWGEWIHDDERMEYLTFPRLCAYAETCWSMKANRNYGRFARCFEQAHCKRLEHQGIRYARSAFMYEVHKPEEFAAWTKIGGWDKASMKTDYIFEWDATPVVGGNGKYEAALVFTGGSWAMGPRRLDLLRDGELIFSDDHPARIARTCINNVYRFTVNGHVPGTRYTVRMESLGGRTTIGDVKMRRVD